MYQDLSVPGEILGRVSPLRQTVIVVLEFNKKNGLVKMGRVWKFAVQRIESKLFRVKRQELIYPIVLKHLGHGQKMGHVLLRVLTYPVDQEFRALKGHALMEPGQKYVTRMICQKLCHVWRLAPN